jgi:hypothetical protein
MAFVPNTVPSQLCDTSRVGTGRVPNGSLKVTIPHGVVLNCLRKRIKDERFIDLIRKMLQAGIMEADNFSPSYSGTPQGGIASLPTI